ncbi:hypothetical protein OFC58_37105, partial [Escherichia coli]|nr:hypothetical protein [Escherichia coli]
FLKNNLTTYNFQLKFSLIVKNIINSQLSTYKKLKLGWNSWLMQKPGITHTIINQEYFDNIK